MVEKKKIDKYVHRNETLKGLEEMITRTNISTLKSVRIFHKAKIQKLGINRQIKYLEAHNPKFWFHLCSPNN